MSPRSRAPVAAGPAAAALAIALGLGACSRPPIESGLRVTVEAATPLPPIARLSVTATAGVDFETFEFARPDGSAVDLPATIFVETGDRTGVVAVEVIALDATGDAIAIGTGERALVPGEIVNLVIMLAAGDGADAGSNCGDGIQQGNEECDDGNQAANDGCGTQCLFELRDLDGDGHCTPTSFAQDDMGLCVDFLDCDDTDPLVHIAAIETCANVAVDNDCDEVFEVDADADGLEDRGTACTTSLPGECASGALDCLGPALECVAPVAGAELCNALDDDCDGATDEDGDALCAAGETCNGSSGCACGSGAACTGPDVCCTGACMTAALCGCSACGLGETCPAGTCACGPIMGAAPGVPACGAAEACCAGACTSIVDDPANCGGCGFACGPGESCNGIACKCGLDGAPGTGVPACSPVETCCGSGCSILAADAANCGACDAACGSGESCAGGLCSCGLTTAAPGADACAGATDLCCEGTCITCDASFGACAAGGICGCTGGLTACTPTNECVDLLRDPLRCGSCGAADCLDGEICEAGSCVCRPFLLECSGTCVDPQSARSYCGSCINNCGSGNACFEGTCDGDDCASQPGSTDECVYAGVTYCVTGTADDTNPLHCGGCGMPCNSNEICTSESCEPFTVGRGCATCPCADCAGTCCIYPGTADAVICLATGVACPTP